MNTPNKLTLLRVILIPVYMILYLSCGQAGVYAAIVVFILASLTDQLDGYLARKKHQVTTFGKLMDPLADKILTMSAFIAFVEKGMPYITAGVVMIILARELIVTGIRLIALGENQVIAASIWGKAKTVSQMVLVIGVMVFEVAKWHLPMLSGTMDILTLVMTVVTVALTVYSGIDYIWKNRKLIQFK
ncbi:MAG: CDP-diacylglycerol--glycerol-3-phosphate 3-phosphatidyltransferase [Clostridia bacterium]|nr:CDP-diacylglycerol--glycerol-3-phosphate 3-phosphatidyltransferase [Clostridia bacterium]